jgi:Flp pilus assembly protein TadD
LKPDLPAALTTLGSLAAQRGRLGEALELQRKAAAEAPRNADIIQNLATLYHQLGKRSQAVETYSQVLELRPDDATCHNNLAVLYYRGGDYRSARRHVDRARELGLSVHPDFLVALEKAERKKN